MVHCFLQTNYKEKYLIHLMLKNTIILCKTIREAEKVGSKGYASTYNVEILNSFNTELQFKDIEYAIRSKLTDLLTELNGIQTTKHIACNYGCKLVCVNDTFSKPFKIYLGEEVVYNFINNMIEESKYCTDMMKKHFNQERVMTKEDNGNFRNSAKCWIMLKMML